MKQNRRHRRGEKSCDPTLSAERLAEIHAAQQQIRDRHSQAGFLVKVDGRHVRSAQRPTSQGRAQLEADARARNSALTENLDTDELDKSEQQQRQHTEPPAADHPAAPDIASDVSSHPGRTRHIRLSATSTMASMLLIAAAGMETLGIDLPANPARPRGTRPPNPN